jgi:hypothetical protein
MFSASPARDLGTRLSRFHSRTPAEIYLDVEIKGYYLDIKTTSLLPLVTACRSRLDRKK